MHPCSHHRRRKDRQSPVTSVENTKPMHFSASNTYHDFALGNNLTSHPQVYTNSSEKCLDSWWIFELVWGFILWRLSASEKKQSRTTQHFHFSGFTVFKSKGGTTKKFMGLHLGIFSENFACLTCTMLETNELSAWFMSFFPYHIFFYFHVPWLLLKIQIPALPSMERSPSIGKQTIVPDVHGTRWAWGTLFITWGIHFPLW